MNKVYSLPTPEQAAVDTTNAINQIVLKLQKHLPSYGWEITSYIDEADLVAGHAGQTDGRPVDVAHCHGLYPTHAFPESAWHFAANDHVLRNIFSAREVTVPSQWVGDILRRDLHIDPHVIGWAIDFEDWWPEANPGDSSASSGQGYILWNKTRPDKICDPTPLNELAKRFPDKQFVTTFGEEAPNVRVVGRQPYEVMRQLIRGAGVYLATTRETFGIGTLEPMACAIPVLGYRWAGTADIVQHGVTGFLAEPGDLDGLADGLRYCLTHRATLGLHARAAAAYYTWARVAERFADVYNQAMRRPRHKLAVVIPVHNYAAYVKDAIASVRAQLVNFSFEIIVVDDQSNDDSALAARQALDGFPYYRVVTQGNTGPAGARNTGIGLADAEYILCLDADDQIEAGSPMLQTLADTLDKDRRLGIVYTGLKVLENGKVFDSPWPGAFSFEQQVIRQNQIPTCCMFRRAAWARAGGYRKAYEPAEDADLWTAMVGLGYRAQQVTDQRWFIYRVHMDSFSRTRHQTDWIARFPWTRGGLRPAAAPPPPLTQYPTNPVRDYDRPLFSIVIPVGAGHERYLRDALDSVEAQTDWRWECIAVFDSDYAPAPGEYSGYPWLKMLWTDGAPRGPGYARNAGARAAVGQFLVFLDADDLIHPDFLDATYRKFKETGRYIYTDWMSIGKTGAREIHQTPEYDPVLLFKRQSLHAVTILLPKADWEAVGGFEETMGAWEDVELYLRLAAAGFCGARLARPLLTYRYSTGNLREYGETIKDQLKAALYGRYQDYIEGRKMCQCEEILAKNRQQSVHTFELPEDADAMRVILDGDNAPAAKMPIKGESGRLYGRRGRGDVFLILKQDFASMSHLVSPYQEYQTAEARTHIPPAPPDFIQRKAIVP